MVVQQQLFTRKLSSELCAALTELPSCRVDELRRELIHKYHMELVNKDVGMLALLLVEGHTVEHACCRSFSLI